MIEPGGNIALPLAPPRRGRSSCQGNGNVRRRSERKAAFEHGYAGSGKATCAILSSRRKRCHDTPARCVRRANWILLRSARGRLDEIRNSLEGPFPSHYSCVGAPFAMAVCKPGAATMPLTRYPHGRCARLLAETEAAHGYLDIAISGRNDLIVQLNLERALASLRTISRTIAHRRLDPTFEDQVLAARQGLQERLLNVAYVVIEP